MLAPELIARRDGAAQRHDRALDRFANRVGDGFISEMDAVIEDLRSVCDAISDSEQGAEVSRCFSWLADACFDRGQGGDPAWLERGRSYYQRAEAALGTGDLILRAKLDYNFANTLRGLSQGSRLPELREAEQRYRRALAVFRAHVPILIPAAETATVTIEQQRSLAERMASVAEGMSQLQQLQARLEHGDAEGVAAALEEFKRSSPSVEVMAQGLMHELERMTAVLGMDPAHVGPAKEQVQRNMAALGLGPSPVMRSMWEMLLARYESDVANGKVKNQRLLDSVLAQLQDLLAEQPHDDLTTMAAWQERLRDVLTEFLQAQQNQDHGASALAERRLRLHRVVLEEQLQPQRARGERDFTGEVFIELANLKDAIDKAGSDPLHELEVERERLRPLAERWRNYVLRHHLILAQPTRWPRDSAKVDANAIAWFGSAARQPEVSRFCEQRGFRMFERGNLDAARAAWTAARTSAVVIAELVGAHGPGWAETCYALGLAACAGTPVVLLIAPGEVPPFDFDLPPIELHDGLDLVAELSERVDAAMFARRALDASDGGLAATLSHARTLFNEGLAGTLFSNLRAESEDDPTHVRALLVQAVGVAGSRAPLLLTPNMPVPYPDPVHLCCFHATPFDRPGEPVRFKAVGDAAREACRIAGVIYLHGNESTDRRILSSIWNDIGRSRYVLVDLTDENPNVAYELAIAHALGREVLAIGAAGTQERLFPAISKERVTLYDPLAPAAALTPELTRLLERR